MNSPLKVYYKLRLAVAILYCTFIVLLFGWILWVYLF